MPAATWPGLAAPGCAANPAMEPPPILMEPTLAPEKLPDGGPDVEGGGLPLPPSPLILFLPAGPLLPPPPPPPTIGVPKLEPNELLPLPLPPRVWFLPPLLLRLTREDDDIPAFVTVTADGSSSSDPRSSWTWTDRQTDRQRWGAVESSRITSSRVKFECWRCWTKKKKGSTLLSVLLLLN